jgi:hypothetical protein
MRQENTFMRDQLPSLLHRFLGEGLYCSDVDSLEYTWKNGDVEFNCIIDYKNPTNSADRKLTYQTIRVQSKLATALSIPMFVVQTYLDDNYPIKMMYVMPVNKIAKYIFNSLNKNPDGIWLSIRNYSRFLHYIRKIPNDEKTQKLLCDDYKEYPLPGDADHVRKSIL